MHGAQPDGQTSQQARSARWADVARTALSPMGRRRNRRAFSSREGGVSATGTLAERALLVAWLIAQSWGRGVGALC